MYDLGVFAHFVSKWKALRMVCIDHKGESNLSNAKSEGHIIVTRNTFMVS